MSLYYPSIIRRFLISAFLIAVSLLAAPVEFPMECTGVLEAYSFFNQSVEHFIYGNIEADVRVLRIGRFSWKLGLSFETYMGESWNSPEMKFNIYGGHWNLKTQFEYQLEPVLLRLYTDHECFHNIDMADTLSEYMNNIKLGVVLEDPAPVFSDDICLLPAGWPDGWCSLGFYRPRGDTYQKGHDFNWSMHCDVNFEGVTWHSWLSGVRYHADFFFHDGGGSSSRHRGELYFAYRTTAGSFETHLTHYFRDTQPFRSLDGETCWGIRFIW